MGIRQERRRFLRLGKPVVVKYSHLGEIRKDGEYPGKNLSSGGVCAVLNEKEETGTFINLRVYLPDNSFPIRIKGRVVWVRSSSDIKTGQQLFDTGIEFAEIDELDFKKISKYINDNQMRPELSE